MPVLSDFTVISKPDAAGRDGTFEKPYLIGDATGGNSLKVAFGTGGRAHAPGLLSLMVRRLTDGAANVRITTSQSNHVLGQLTPSDAEDMDTWRHEQFIIPTNVLSSANGSPNTLHLGVVAETGQGGGNFDDYQVRDIVCFFHQEA